jgi:calcineurin-like phosphoesterase family protein
MKFYTADEHYGHRRIIDFCKRPFADIVEMREFLIKAHNAKVGKGDLTYHIGDMFWHDMAVDEALYIMGRLNGQHKFVYGNHDEMMERSPEVRSKFLEMDAAIFVHRSNFCPAIYLHHYACRVWRDSHKGSYHLYGHSHAALPEANTLSFDCGVDSRPDYAPWSEEEIVAKMKAKKAAGAKDEMTVEIENNPWNKAEGAEAPYPLLEMPKVPEAVWNALKEANMAVEVATGSKWSPININGRCV